MKKILSILVFVLVGVGSMYGQAESTTVYAQAVYNPDPENSNQYIPGGGVVRAIATQWKKSGLTTLNESNVAGENSTPSTPSSATGMGGYAKFITTTTKKYKVGAEWVSSNDGYYLSGWYNADTVGSTRLSTADSFTKSLDYNATIEEPLNHFYAFFEPVKVTKIIGPHIYVYDVGEVGYSEVKFVVSAKSNGLRDFEAPYLEPYANSTGTLYPYEDFELEGDPIFKEGASGKADTVIVKLKYTDQNAYGNPYARINVCLKGKYQATPIKKSIYAYSYCNPVFGTIPSDTLDFTPIEPLATGQYVDLTIEKVDSTKASQDATWSVTLDSEAAAKGFSLVSAKTEPNATVRFEALDGINQADLIATLTIKATYKTGNNKSRPITKTIILTGDAGKVITLNGAQATTRTISIEHSATETWQEESVEFLTTLSGIVVTPNGFPTGEDENKIQCVWADTEVKVRLSSTMSPGLHTPTVNFASSGVEAVLNIEALVYLAQPIVTATTGLGQAIGLTWTEVHGATGYVVKCGDMILATIDDPTVTSFMVDMLGETTLRIGEEYSFTVIAIYNTMDNPASSESESILATPTIQSSITKDDLPKLYTGTEIFVEEDNPDIKTDDAYTVFPYYQKRQIDLSPAFASNGTPLFDYLYVFGLTTSEEALTYEGINGHKITKAGSSAGSNAITPCYIYKKDGTTGYILDRTVTNMNVADKDPYFNITVDGKKRYFTGYCPYATTGYGATYGVVCVTGTANQEIDLYLHDLCLYARTHTKDGITSKNSGDVVNIDLNLNNNNYPEFSVAVFTFKTTNTNSSTPFKPTIHLLGKNELEGANGFANLTYMGINLNSQPTLYSSAIQIAPTKDNQCTSLSIDDEWLIDENNVIRTNGILDVAPDAFGRPSIDLGNDKSTLNINGGQLYVRNAYPESSSYVSTFAIGSRSKLIEQEVDIPFLGKISVKATLVGFGDDTGGYVNFNDGTINCLPISDDIMAEYGYLYRSSISMKCPEHTIINGGTYNCDVWACEKPSSLGASPKNSAGDALASLKVPVIREVAPYYLAEINFDQHPGDLINNVEGDANQGETLYEYYVRKSISYGHSSMKAVAATNAGDPDSVNLMLPSQYTGKEALSDVIAHGWAFCIPKIEVSGSVNLSFGGATTVLCDENNVTNYMLYGVLDDPITRIKNYTTPETYAGIIDVELEFAQDVNGTPKYTENIRNEESYTIENAQYVVMPVCADEWMLFSPPFDVSNVYVVETYTEDKLEKISDEEGNMDQAIALQAEANMDFFFHFAFQIVENESKKDFGAIYKTWLQDKSKLNKGNGLIKLEHFTGRNYHANYYLQRSSGVWGWDGANQKFTTDWTYLPADTVNDAYYDSDHTDYNVIMKKGDFYSLKFPYMYYGYREEMGKWDYWTGKYVIFEGLGPQTIEGTNHHNTITSDMKAASGSAEIRVNNTFASMEVSGMGAYYLGENQRFTPSPFDDESKSIDATQGFVLLNKPTSSPMPQRIASIDMMTGDVTYEPGDGIENTVTGTPTISGEREMLVYTVAGGLGVVPVVPQHVSIYNAAGQLVVSQYLTDNTQFALPTGIYLVRGEKDQAKAMVK